MSKVHLITNEYDGYEAVYVNGQLFSSGLPVNEGMERLKYFIFLEDKFDFSIRDIVYGYVELEDDFTNSITELNWREI